MRTYVRYSSRPQAGLLDDLPPDMRPAIEIVRGDLRDFNAVLDATQGPSVILPHTDIQLSIFKQPEKSQCVYEDFSAGRLGVPL